MNFYLHYKAHILLLFLRTSHSFTPGRMKRLYAMFPYPYSRTSIHHASCWVCDLNSAYGGPASLGVRGVEPPRYILVTLITGCCASSLFTPLVSRRLRTTFCKHSIYSEGFVCLVLVVFPFALKGFPRKSVCRALWFVGWSTSFFLPFLLTHLSLILQSLFIRWWLGARGDLHWWWWGCGCWYRAKTWVSWSWGCSSWN